ncbi:endospore germination permease [Paenibacillus tarimensis]
MKVLSLWQMYGLMLLFQLGTSVVFGIASPAKQDAWLTTFISFFLGAGLLWLYSKLYESRQCMNWFGLLTDAFGRWAGTVLGAVYVIIFIYSAGRNLRDAGELTNTFLLPRTPMGATMVLFQILVCYVCYAGLRRMGRLAELNAPIILLFFVLEVVLLLASGAIDLTQLTPVAAEWRPIATTVFPGSVTVPYGEAFAFAAFWSMTTSPKGFFKASLLAAATAGFIFVVLDVVAISTLGPELFSRSFFPLMTTFHMVNIADFIQNLDPLIVTDYMIGVLFKISIFTFAACVVISDMCRVDLRAAVIPVSIMIFLFAKYMADSLSSHLFTGHHWATWVIFTPFFLLVPALAFLIIKFKSVDDKEAG